MKKCAVCDRPTGVGFDFCKEHYIYRDTPWAKALVRIENRNAYIERDSKKYTFVSLDQAFTVEDSEE